MAHGNAVGALRAARFIATGHGTTQYVVGTGSGFVVEPRPPAGDAGYYEVEPDGTVTTYAWQGGKRQPVEREKPLPGGGVERWGWSDGRFQVVGRGTNPADHGPLVGYGYTYGLGEGVTFYCLDHYGEAEAAGEKQMFALGGPDGAGPEDFAGEAACEKCGKVLMAGIGDHEHGCAIEVGHNCDCGFADRETNPGECYRGPESCSWCALADQEAHALVDPRGMLHGAESLPELPRRPNPSLVILGNPGASVRIGRKTYTVEGEVDMSPFPRTREIYERWIMLRGPRRGNYLLRFWTDGGWELTDAHFTRVFASGGRGDRPTVPAPAGARPNPNILHREEERRYAKALAAVRAVLPDARIEGLGGNILGIVGYLPGYEIIVQGHGVGDLPEKPAGPWSVHAVPAGESEPVAEEENVAVPKIRAALLRIAGRLEPPAAAGCRFTTDESEGRTVSLGEMLEANRDDPELCGQIAKMRPGETLETGGGAWARGWVKCLPPEKTNPGRLVDAIQVGDRVTIVDRFGQERTGRAVMRSSVGGWVLNMGGAHGTPGLADEDNIVKVRPGKNRHPDYFGGFLRGNPWKSRKSPADVVQFIYDADWMVPEHFERTHGVPPHPDMLYAEARAYGKHGGSTAERLLDKFTALRWLTAKGYVRVYGTEPDSRELMKEFGSFLATQEGKKRRPSNPAAGPFFVLPYREDGRYASSQAIAVYQVEHAAEKFAEKRNREPGAPPRGFVVRSDPYVRVDNPRKKTFAPGDSVRLTGEFLRSTGQVSGPEGRAVWTVVPCSCGLCRAYPGDFVAVDQPSDGGVRHIGTPNIEKVRSGGDAWAGRHIYGAKRGECGCARCRREFAEFEERGKGTNPPPSPALTNAFEEFHHVGADTAEILRLPNIPGVPRELMGLGELVEIGVKRNGRSGVYQPDAGCRVLLGYSPKTETLYAIPASGCIEDLDELEGMHAVSVTYRPHDESGKDRADYQHDFETPHPRLAACGGKGIRFAGGRYSVSDWIHH